MRHEICTLAALPIYIDAVLCLPLYTVLVQL
jgi:hypothetical protein